MNSHNLNMTESDIVSIYIGPVDICKCVKYGSSYRAYKALLISKNYRWSLPLSLYQHDRDSYPTSLSEQITGLTRRGLSVGRTCGLPIWSTYESARQPHSHQVICLRCHRRVHCVWRGRILMKRLCSDRCLHPAYDFKFHSCCVSDDLMRIPKRTFPEHIHVGNRIPQRKSVEHELFKGMGRMSLSTRHPENATI